MTLLALRLLVLPRGRKRTETADRTLFPAADSTFILQTLQRRSAAAPGEPPRTQHGHHGGHHQRLFTWVHDILQRREQLIQRCRDGGGGCVLAAGRCNSLLASLLAESNSGAHTTSSWHLLPCQSAAPFYS